MSVSSYININNIMKLHEILNESERLDEKPMGLLKKAGLGIASQFSNKAAGKLEVGNKINAVKKDFEKYLGRSNQQASLDVLLKYLEIKGYPTERASKVVPGVNPVQPNTVESINEQALPDNIIDKVISAAVEDSFKAVGRSSGSGKSMTPTGAAATSTATQELTFDQLLDRIDRLDKTKKQAIVDRINKSLSTSW